MQKEKLSVVQSKLNVSRFDCSSNNLFLNFSVFYCMFVYFLTFLSKDVIY